MTTELEVVDLSFAKTDRIIVPVTPALKWALMCVSHDQRETIAGITRSAIFKYTESKYPAFVQYYESYSNQLSRETK